MRLDKDVPRIFPLSGVAFLFPWFITERHADVKQRFQLLGSLSDNSIDFLGYSACSSSTNGLSLDHQPGRRPLGSFRSFLFFHRKLLGSLMSPSHPHAFKNSCFSSKSPPPMISDTLIKQEEASASQLAPFLLHLDIQLRHLCHTFLLTGMGFAAGVC